MKELSRQIIVTVNFAKIFSFCASRLFGLNLGQNYVTLYLMISSKKLFEM